VAKRMCVRCLVRQAKHISRSQGKVRSDRQHDLCPGCAEKAKDAAYVVTDPKEVIRVELPTVEERMQARITALEERLAGYEGAIDALAGKIEKDKPYAEMVAPLLSLLVQRGTEDAERAARLVAQTYPGALIQES
jgi:uncharacterized coiled-coil protein SlyX